MGTAEQSLVLRLAGPLQSWAGQSQFNRRDTLTEPTKSGIVGLLAAAQGRRRQDPIADLVELRLGIRVDQPGSVLRDYHTVARRSGRRITVGSAGIETFAKTDTHVTQRFYLQDAVFVVAIGGSASLLSALGEAVASPQFPLALGRRGCPPAQPLLLRADTETNSPLWRGEPIEALRAVPWQASQARLRALKRNTEPPAQVDLPAIVDDPNGDDMRSDLPRSFDPRNRSFGTRTVRHEWIRVATGFTGAVDEHDPFALLGW